MQSLLLEQARRSAKMQSQGPVWCRCMGHPWGSHTAALLCPCQWGWTSYPHFCSPAGPHRKIHLLRICVQEKEKAYWCTRRDEIKFDLKRENRQLNSLRSLRLTFLAFWEAKWKRCFPMSLVYYCHCPLETRQFIHAESWLEQNYTKEKILLKNISPGIKLLPVL